MCEVYVYVICMNLWISLLLRLTGEFRIFSTRCLDFIIFMYRKLSVSDCENSKLNLWKKKVCFVVWV